MATQQKPMLEAQPASWWVNDGWTWRDAWPLFRRTHLGFVIAGRWRYRRATRAVVVTITADTSAFDAAMRAARRAVERLRAREV